MDVRKLNKKHLTMLASLFDELEVSARKIGGANTFDSGAILGSTLQKIDGAVAKIVGLSPRKIAKIRQTVNALVERRLKDSDARPEILVGEEKQRIKVPKKVRTMRTKDNDTQLDRWFS